MEINGFFVLKCIHAVYYFSSLRTKTRHLCSLLVQCPARERQNWTLLAMSMVQRGTRVTRVVNELKCNSVSPRGANGCYVRVCIASNIRPNQSDGLRSNLFWRNKIRDATRSKSRVRNTLDLWLIGCNTRCISIERWKWREIEKSLCCIYNIISYILLKLEKLCCQTCKTSRVGGGIFN